MALISFSVTWDRSVFFGKKRLINSLICSTNPFSQRVLPYNNVSLCANIAFPLMIKADDLK